jgi:hypothetical protein
MGDTDPSHCLSGTTKPLSGAGQQLTIWFPLRCSTIWGELGISCSDALSRNGDRGLHLRWCSSLQTTGSTAHAQKFLEIALEEKIAHTVNGRIGA